MNTAYLSDLHLVGDNTIRTRADSARRQTRATRPDPNPATEDYAPRRELDLSNLLAMPEHRDFADLETPLFV